MTELTNAKVGISIDTESLGLEPSSIVTQVAFIAFPLDDPETIIRDAYEFLPVEPQMSVLNRTWSFATLLWWMDQPPAVRDSLKRSTGNDMEELLALVRGLLRKIREVIAEAESYEIWVRRPQHDIPLLASLITACGEEVPWAYDRINDLSTLMNLAGIDKGDVDKSGLTTHTARGDALFQIRCYSAGMLRLRSNT